MRPPGVDLRSLPHSKGRAGEFDLYNLRLLCSAGTLPGFHRVIPTRWQMVYYSSRLAYKMMTERHCSII
ncbi:MAG TPA: hypothetical protein VJ965_01665 [Anaerolineales bacterium]|nr:hypothetical protein [Anaerolineales bacterium]